MIIDERLMGHTKKTTLPEIFNIVIIGKLFKM